MKNWICNKEFLNVKIIDVFEECVGYQTLPVSELENFHSLFRRKFNLKKEKGKKYILKITADDSYKLYVNGSFVGQGPACGYFSHYYYNTYDISDFLCGGDNVISVDAYYHGRVDYAHTSADNRQGMWAELYSENECILKSDDVWKCIKDESFSSCGISWGYDTQFAENIDRRKHPRGWMLTDFDDSDWENACVKEDDDHILVEQPTKTVSRREIYPETITKFCNNHFLLDFGKEIVGHIHLKAKSQAGSKVIIKCAEELTEDGHAKYNMRCGVDFIEEWILADGEDSFESYDYSGFRFIELEMSDGSIRPENFSVIVRHYPYEKKKEFKSDNALLNEIWKICENAVIMSTQEGFFDCPQREKAQYLGDMLITGFSYYHITGDIDMLKKALGDFMYSQNFDEGMMCVAPASLKHRIADYSLLFPLISLNFYKITKDKEFLEKLVFSCEKIIHHYEKYKRHDGLLSGVKEWNLVDWPENLRDGYDFDTNNDIGVHNVINAYYLGALKTMNELYDILESKKRYDYEKIAEAYFKAFFNEEAGLFADSEGGEHFALHSNVLPCFYGFTNKNQSEKIIKLIMEKGLACGVYFSYFVLKALALNGENEKAMELILNKSEHSWYNMIKEGATACFEAWGKEQKTNTSLCHPWASSPIILLCEDFGF